MKKIAPVLVFCLIALWGLYKYEQAQLELLRRKEASILKLLAPKGFVPDNFIKDFETTHNALVRLTPFSEDQLETLEEFDVAILPGYRTKKLIENNQVQALDEKKLKNKKEIHDDFEALPFDPNGSHVVPFNWGIVGLIYNKKEIPTPPQSWKIFLNKKYQGKTSLLDDKRPVIGAFLKYHHLPVNAQGPSELNKARDTLMKAKPFLGTFSPIPKASLLSGEILVAQVKSGNAYQLMKNYPDFDFVIPKEGSIIFLNVLAIPQGSSNPKLAHSFIDFVLSPRIARSLTVQTQFASPNKSVEEIEMRESLKPSHLRAMDMGQIEYMRDLGRGKSLWNAIWSEVKN